ncbi:MAG: hypothetical protein ONB05_10515 [candidate division KSB1 bacterium]|nr:hypothetical protein [candidate division KSB1 bacterium]
MRKLTLIILVGIIFFLSSNMLPAQEKTPRIGVGVSLGKEAIPIEDYEVSAVFTLFDFPSFYIPILISPRFKLEPEIGLYRYSRSTKDSESSNMVFSLGCSIFPMTQKGKVSIYYGARLEIVRFSFSYKYSQDGHHESREDSNTDFYIGPAIGGEYFFTEHLSVGGETQVNFIFIGQGDDTEDTSESVIRTKTLIFLRWYF